MSTAKQNVVSIKEGVEEITVTPEMAGKFLGLSVVNRNIRLKDVEAYAGMMYRGEFSPSEIVFDDRGVFIDGHHRLMAILKFGKPVRLRVRYGLDQDSALRLDGGTRRNIGDKLRMYRHDMQNIARIVANTSACAAMLIGKSRTIKIHNLDDFDAWYEFFKPGIDGAIGILNKGTDESVKKSTIVSAVAFAWKADPDRVADFAEKLQTGIGLVSGDPAYALRTFLHRADKNVKFRGTGNGRTNYATAVVMSAAYNHVHGKRMTRMDDNPEASRFFHGAYNKASVTKLLDKMLPYRSKD